MEYYVYENWTRDRGRIHSGECGHCNHGQGNQPQDSGRNGKWHGPFERDAAFVYARGLNKSDMKPCSVCNP